MDRHVMQVLQTSLQGSCKLGDGALLLHGSDQGHLQIRRPLKLRSQAVIVSADHLYRVDAGAAHPSRSQIPMGGAGNVSVTSGAQPSFQTADGAQKILAANARGVTQAFPTTRMPVDTRKTGNVLRTERIGQQAIDFPEILKILGIATEVRFPHIGAGKFSCAAGKAGNPALAYLLNLRKCGGRP